MMIGVAALQVMASGAQEAAFGKKPSSVLSEGAGGNPGTPSLVALVWLGLTAVSSPVVATSALLEQVSIERLLEAVHNTFQPWSRPVGLGVFLAVKTTMALEAGFAVVVGFAAIMGQLPQK